MNSTILEDILGYVVPAIFTFILKDFFDVFLFKRKMQGYKNIAIWTIYFFIDHTIRSFSSFNTVISIIYNTIILVIVCRVLYIDSMKRIILIVLFILCLGCIAEALIGFIIIIIVGSVDNLQLWGSICSKIMLLIMLRIVKMLKFYKYKNIFSIKNWILSISLTIGSLYIINNLFLFNQNEQDNSNLERAVMSAIILLLLNVIVFKVFDLLVVYTVRQQESAIYKQQISFFEMQIIEREESLNKMRKYRHDFNNHITCIRELIDNEEYSRALEYIESIAIIDAENNLPFNGSGNTVVDALLKAKYTIASHYGILVIPTLEIPSKLPFRDSDICVIIGNSLDNAIEALKDSSIEPKRIYVEIQMRHSNLLICVKNKYEDKIMKDSLGKILTRKRDNINHGIGIKSMETVVEKYNGIMDINTCNNNFELSILLYSE